MWTRLADSEIEPHHGLTLTRPARTGTTVLLTVSICFARFGHVDISGQVSPVSIKHNSSPIRQDLHGYVSLLLVKKKETSGTHKTAGQVGKMKRNAYRRQTLDIDSSASQVYT